MTNKRTLIHLLSNPCSPPPPPLAVPPHTQRHLQCYDPRFTVRVWPAGPREHAAGLLRAETPRSLVSLSGLGRYPDRKQLDGLWTKLSQHLNYTLRPQTRATWNGLFMMNDLDVTIWGRLGLPHSPPKIEWFIQFNLITHFNKGSCFVESLQVKIKVRTGYTPVDLKSKCHVGNKYVVGLYCLSFQAQKWMRGICNYNK